MFGFFSGILGLATVATSIVSSLSSTLKAVGVALVGVGHIIENLGRNLGVINKDEDAVTLGRQAQAAEDLDIKLDDFESFDEYVAKVREQQVDKNLDDLENKDDFARKGMDLIMGLAVEKFGQPTMEKVGEILGKAPEDANLILSSKSVADFISEDKNNLENIVGYLNGDNTSETVRNVILDGISSSKPELNEDECIGMVKDLREQINGDQ